MWSNKYHPFHVKHIILDNSIRSKIKNFLPNNTLQNLIISGSSGTGKSTLLDCIARDFYGKEYSSHVHKLNASIEKNIKLLQDDMELFCKRQLHDTCVKKNKLFIIDDVDDIPTKIQNVIASIMVKYQNVNFLFSCCISSNVLDVIQTRCVILRLLKPTDEQLILRLELICNKEHCKYNKEALERICFISHNDIRIAINKIQTLANEYGIVNIENINNICDTPNIIALKNIIKFCIQKQTNSALDVGIALYNDGFNCADILSGIFDILKSTVMTKDLIDEDLKIKFLTITGKMIYKVSKKVDSQLQLEKYIIKLCEV